MVALRFFKAINLLRIKIRFKWEAEVILRIMRQNSSLLELRIINRLIKLPQISTCLPSRRPTNLGSHMSGI